MSGWWALTTYIALQSFPPRTVTTPLPSEQWGKPILLTSSPPDYAPYLVPPTAITSWDQQELQCQQPTAPLTNKGHGGLGKYNQAASCQYHLTASTNHRLPRNFVKWWKPSFLAFALSCVLVVVGHPWLMASLSSSLIEWLTLIFSKGGYDVAWYNYSYELDAKDPDYYIFLFSYSLPCTVAG